jgi:hypothetical protein
MRAAPARVSTMIHVAMFVVVVLLAGLLFVFWLFYLLVRGIFWLGKQAIHGPQHRVSLRRCTRMRCGAPNPQDARYCRRCGLSFAGAPANVTRRMAMQRV